VATDFGHTVIPDTPQHGSVGRRNPDGIGGVPLEEEDNTPSVGVPPPPAGRVTT